MARYQKLIISKLQIYIYAGWILEANCAVVVAVPTAAFAAVKAKHNKGL